MAAGAKTGGRQKGTPNKRTIKQKAEMAAKGEMPLDYMLRVMRDPSADYERRDKMAASAARYCHPALNAVTDKDGNKLEFVVRHFFGPPGDLAGQ